MGLKGYGYVVDSIFNNYIDTLDPQGDCPVIEHIRKKWKNQSSKGNWATWKYVTIRTVSQMKKVYK